MKVNIDSGQELKVRESFTALISAAILAFSSLVLNGCTDKSLSRGEAERVFYENPQNNPKIITFTNNYLISENPRTREFLEDFGFRIAGWLDTKDRNTSLYALILARFPDIPEKEELNGYVLLVPNPTKDRAEIKAELKVEATGIRMLSETTAQVAFKWSRESVPKFWHPLIEVNGDASASYALYDDGWRIEHFKLTRSVSHPLTKDSDLHRVLAFHKELVLPCAIQTDLAQNWASADVPDDWTPGSAAPVSVSGHVYCE